MIMIMTRNYDSIQLLILDFPQSLSYVEQNNKS